MQPAAPAPPLFCEPCAAQPSNFNPRAPPLREPASPRAPSPGLEEANLQARTRAAVLEGIAQVDVERGLDQPSRDCICAIVALHLQVGKVERANTTLLRIAAVNRL